MSRLYPVALAVAILSAVSAIICLFGQDKEPAFLRIIAAGVFAILAAVVEGKK